YSRNLRDSGRLAICELKKYLDNSRFCQEIHEFLVLRVTNATGIVSIVYTLEFLHQIVPAIVDSRD
ncbi:MAG: hypothetical protein ACK53L_14735, partial [Pirellulaceae bacterium]